MNLLIAGDIVPIGGNISLFEKGDIETLLGTSLYRKWIEADSRVFNLEAPIYDGNTPISKCGPNLKAPTATVQGIIKLQPSLVSLANNHILDHGSEGLNTTLDLFKKLKIKSIGADINLDEASKPKIIDINGKRIGFYSCAEHEFSIATDTSLGANPFNPLESLDHIRDLSQQVDYTIILFHGGKEHYRYPSPYLQKVCRKMVEKGADLVVCQHSHCIGCEENYRNKKIVYGQGNFIFDYSESEFWQTSLIINLDLESFEISYIPIEKQNEVIRESDDIAILDSFKKRSQEIKQNGFIEKSYECFAKQSFNNYAYNLSGMGKWLGRLDRHLFNNYFVRKKMSKERLNVIRNYIECEAHRELVIKGIKVYEEH